MGIARQPQGQRTGAATHFWRDQVTGWGHCIRVTDGAMLSDYVGAMGDISGASPAADDAHDIVYFADYQDGGGGGTTEETWAVQLTLSTTGVEGIVRWHPDGIATASVARVAA